MTPHDLQALVDTAKENGRTEVVLTLPRKCKGERVRIAPGLTGKIVQWGDGTAAFPTVAFFEVADIDRALAKNLALQRTS